MVLWKNNIENKRMRINRFVCGARYMPTWESLDSHPAAAWFEDAKFGMFIDWGLYSIPGWAPRKKEGAMYPDWYLYNMIYENGTHPRELILEHHKRHWGDGFKRDDFIPLFSASEYDPDNLVETAARAGMRYVIPFCKHHDGFCLWDSVYTGRDAMDMTPKCDLIKPLADACRRMHLKFGAYYSLDEWEYPLIAENGKRMTRLWGSHDPQLVEHDERRVDGLIGGKTPVRDFYGDYILPQCRELIDKFDPDILWFDGEWNVSAEKRRSREIVAYFYNQAEGRKDVVVNDRMGTETRFKHGDFFCSEYHSHAAEAGGHAWEECRGLGQSFGYNRDDTEKNILTPNELIHLLVRTVARGGNLLLVVNLAGSGKLPSLETERLREIGAWLKVNGEAIYGTRPLNIKSDHNAYFTRGKDNSVYIIYLAWPENKIVFETDMMAGLNDICLLGHDQSLKWKKEDGNIHVFIPDHLNDENNRPCRYAWVFKLDLHSS